MRGATLMRKKLVKHGNSRALVLDKTMLELLGIGEDDEVEVGVHGDEVRLRRVGPDEERRERFEEAQETCERQYSGLLRRLAE